MKINGLKQTLLIIIGLVITVLSVVWVFIIIESYSYRSEIVRISDEIKSAANRDSYLSSIRNVLRGTEGDIGAIENRFIGEDDVPGFIEFLERQTRDIGIKAELTGINLDPVIKNSVFRVLHVRINASGSWQEAISFINALDMMPYAMNIDHISLSKMPDSSIDSKVPPNSVWNIVIDISQYTK
ncbi:MAG: hypothetical protein Q7R72_01670 [bacterium]|nr:hypothetical protein [bacterium]